MIITMGMALFVQFILNFPGRKMSDGQEDVWSKEDAQASVQLGCWWLDAGIGSEAIHDSIAVRKILDVGS